MPMYVQKPCSRCLYAADQPHSLFTCPPLAYSPYYARSKKICLRKCTLKKKCKIAHQRVRHLFFLNVKLFDFSFKMNWIQNNNGYRVPSLKNMVWHNLLIIIFNFPCAIDVCLQITFIKIVYSCLTGYLTVHRKIMIRLFVLCIS